MTKQSQNMTLKQHLNSLGEIINEKIPYVNYGGCCTFAAIVGAELKKFNIGVCGFSTGKYSKFINVDIIRHQLHDTSDPYEWESKGIGFDHIGLEIYYDRRKWHYDSEGVVKASSTFDNLPIYSGRFTIEELKMLSENTTFWNVQFKRKNIPRIKKIVEKHFQECQMFF